MLSFNWHGMKKHKYCVTFLKNLKMEFPCFYFEFQVNIVTVSKINLCSVFPNTHCRLHGVVCSDIFLYHMIPDELCTRPLASCMTNFLSLSLHHLFVRLSHFLSLALSALYKWLRLFRCFERKIQEKLTRSWILSVLCQWKKKYRKAI